MRAWRGVSSGFAAASGDPAGPGCVQQRDGRALPDVDPHEVQELKVFRGEVMTLAVQRKKMPISPPPGAGTEIAT